MRLSHAALQGMLARDRGAPIKRIVGGRVSAQSGERELLLDQGLDQRVHSGTVETNAPGRSIRTWQTTERMAGLWEVSPSLGFCAIYRLSLYW
jgi:hypothetical protein